MRRPKASVGFVRHAHTPCSQLLLRLRFTKFLTSRTLYLAAPLFIFLAMLTTLQKADILRKSGCAVPVEAEPSTAWSHRVDALFVEYVAARAAKSLRDAEEARQLDRLRSM